METSSVQAAATRLTRTGLLDLPWLDHVSEKIVKFSLFGININFSNADMKFLFLMNDWKLSLLSTRLSARSDTVALLID